MDTRCAYAYNISRVSNYSRIKSDTARKRNAFGPSAEPSDATVWKNTRGRANSSQSKGVARESLLFCAKTFGLFCAIFSKLRVPVEKAKTRGTPNGCGEVSRQNKAKKKKKKIQ